jgi:DNA mismatch repair protein MutS
VAQLAGMPKSIVERAKTILSNLEGKQTNKAGALQSVAQREGLQLSFFQLDDPVLEQIRNEVKALDINNITPIDALNKLSEIKKLVGG